MGALWALNFFGGIDTENVPLRMWSAGIVFALAALLAAQNRRRVVNIFKGVPHPNGDRRGGC